MDNICKFCIEILEWWSLHTPITYSEINVWLFIIIQPLLITIFCITTIYSCNTENKIVKKVITYFTIVFYILLINMVIIMILYPIWMVS